MKPRTPAFNGTPGTHGKLGVGPSHKRRALVAGNLPHIRPFRGRRRPDVARALCKNVHPDDLAKVDANIQAALQKDVIDPLEYRVITEQHGIRHIRGEGRVERDASGATVRMRGFVQEHHGSQAGRRSGPGGQAILG